MSANELLIIEGPEQAKVDTSLPDGGIPPAVGVQSWCVFRASRAVPEIADQYGWTYHHHVDMACWKGRLYVGWNSCEKDEDIWPSRELYSTSTDGATWTDPAEMFPQGLSTCLRMYFYLAGNGRMLVIAGLRVSTSKTSEDLKGGLIVREIRPDHTLGEIFALQVPRAVSEHPRMFDRSTDPDFVAACRQLLADTVFLEQQDRGRLLGSRRMRWHDPSAWPGGKVPGDSDKWVCGKAFSFYRRMDKLLVGVCKMGWVTSSADDGRTWSQPAVPATFVTGKAKAWAQRTSDGRFALVYNPTKRFRYPLIAVHSDDGEHFRDMRIIHGEMPRQRYPGRDRSIGPQYTRGISHWADDGSRAGDQAMWLVYSMSKEDIWVSRVPLPIKPDATTFDEPWNTYCPKWASVKASGDSVELECHDPYDYAKAVRVFPASAKIRASFRVEPRPGSQPGLEVELVGGFGSPRPVRLVLAAEKLAGAVNVAIEADATRGHYSATVDGRMIARDEPFAVVAASLSRIAFRTGEYRGVGGAHPVDPATDRPSQSVGCRVQNLELKSGD